MPILPSRRIEPEEFLKDFLATIRPGVIRRKEFIPWQDVFSRIRFYQSAIEFFESIEPQEFQSNPRKIADMLLSADDPYEFIMLGFEILGHTGNTFTTFEDRVEISQISQEIKEGNEQAALYLIDVWKELGLPNILNGDVSSALLGVEIGLACNKRKNLGGRLFGVLVGELLKDIVKQIGLPESSLKTELSIPLGRGGQKKVDFAVEIDGAPKLAIEVNFYTTSGSKPTEIKRAYANLNRNLDKRNIILIWITDGVGYYKMQKSLMDAFRVHPNTYNYDMAQRYLADDLKAVGVGR